MTTETVTPTTTKPYAPKIPRIKLWETVHAYPGLNSTELAILLDTTEKTLSSYLYSATQAGQLRREKRRTVNEGKTETRIVYHAVGDKFKKKPVQRMVLPKTKPTKAKAPAQLELPLATEPATAAVTPVTAPTKTPGQEYLEKNFPTLPPPIDKVRRIIYELSLADAKRLYDELHTFFGSKA